MQNNIDKRVRKACEIYLSDRNITLEDIEKIIGVSKKDVESDLKDKERIKRIYGSKAEIIISTIDAKTSLAMSNKLKKTSKRKYASK